MDAQLQLGRQQNMSQPFYRQAVEVFFRKIESYQTFGPLEVQQNFLDTLTVHMGDGGGNLFHIRICGSHIKRFRLLVLVGAYFIFIGP